MPELKAGRTSIISSEQAPREWLFSETAVDRAESILKEHPYQFALLAGEWDYLKAMLQDSDQLWVWGGPFDPETFASLEGYCIVRNGMIVATLALPECTPLDLITGRSHQASSAWLKFQLTVEQVESALKEGALADQWSAMKELASQSGEFWFFFSDPDSWQHLAGRAGYALVRDGKVIATIVTMLN